MRVHTQKLVDPGDGRIVCHLDVDTFLLPVVDELELGGWVVHRDRKISQVQLTGQRRVLANARLEVHRPGVRKRFPDYPNAEKAGFRLRLPAPSPGRYFLEILTGTDRPERIARIDLVRQDKPPLLFVHIPKAAGSSVNTFFASHFPSRRTAVHIESHPKWPGNAEALAKLDFISGHVSLWSLDRRFKLSDYYKVTVLREPFAQLASHLAWIRRLSDRGEERRFEHHPDYIQGLSRKLTRVDFGKASDLKSLIDSLDTREHRLIDNCQIRYLTNVAPGKPVGKAHLEAATRAAESLDRIGTTDDLEGFLAGVARDMGWPLPGVQLRENVTGSFYGLDTTRRRIRKALMPLVRFDLQLYRRFSKP